METFQKGGEASLVQFNPCPIVEVLNPYRSDWHALQPINKNEATNQDNVAILEDIVLNQFGRQREDPWFKTGLMLCAGDQKTIARINAIKNIGHEISTLPFDRFDWVLPIPGLWHLKLNLLLMLNNIHRHPDTSVDITSLQYALDKWDRKSLKDSTPFQDLEDLIIHSYNARIIGLLLQTCSSKFVSADQMRDWIRLQEPQDGKTRLIEYTGSSIPSQQP